MKHILRFFLFFFTAGIVAGTYTSCAEENNCSISCRRMIYCNLFTINPDTKVVLNDTIDSLTIASPGVESLILNNQKKVHSLMLPLHYTADITTFVLYYDYKKNPKNSDTIHIKQSNTPFFESMECGYSMKQNILGIEHSKLELESINISNTEANNNETENLKLLYRYRD